MYQPITGTGSGIAPVVNLPWPFLDKAYVNATVGGAPAVLTWTGASQVTFAAAVPNGTAWEVFRQTASDIPVVDFTDGSVLTESDLDKSQAQALHRLQELEQPTINGTPLAAATGAGLIGWIGAGTGAVIRTVRDKLREHLSITDYGAGGAQATDDSVPLLNTINAAGGNRVELPVGQFRADATRTINSLAHIRGAGSGEGPGALTGTNVSQVIANFLTGHVWDFSASVYGPTIEDLQFSSYSQRTSGAAIHLIGTGTVAGAGPYTVTGSTVSGHRLANLGFDRQADGILIDVGGWGEIERTYHQAWSGSAIKTNGNGVQYLGADYGNEALGGWINKNMFHGDTAASTAQHSSFYSRTGYYKFTENHVLGSKYGVWQEVSQYPAGGLELRGNLFEEQDIASIYMTPLGGAQKAAMVKINDNEFSIISLGAAARVNFKGHVFIEAGSASWISDLSIAGNVFRSAAARAANAFIEVQSGSNVVIQNNTLEGLPANTMKGIVIGAQAQTVFVLDNLIKGTFGTKYTLTANCVLRDFLSGLTAAEVNAITCRDGSMVWVADGNPAASPLAGSSTGCIAVRQGAAWKPMALV